MQHEPLIVMKLLAGGIALVGVALMIDRRASDARLHPSSGHMMDGPSPALIALFDASSTISQASGTVGAKPTG